MIKPLSDSNKDGYVKQKQAEARERNNKISVEVDVDMKQAERTIEGALKYITEKVNKKK